METLKMNNAEADQFGVAAGARKFAVDTVLKALVEHASATDPAIRDRIVETAEVYLKALPETELEQEFAKWSRAYINGLVHSTSS